MTYDNRPVELPGRPADRSWHAEPDGAECLLRAAGGPHSRRPILWDSTFASTFWGSFGSFQNVQISASSGLVEFTGNISLSAQNSFTINAASIKASSAAGNVSDAINAPNIYLLNTGGLTGSSSLQNVNSLSLNANEIYVGEGALLIDGFSSVNFNALNDITFRGAGLSSPGPAT